MRSYIISILIVLLILLLFVVGCALVLAWSLLIGWLLTQVDLLGFSLFEASLLSMLASTIVGWAAFRVLRAALESSSVRVEDDLDDLEDDIYAIPANRFYRTPEEKTAEAWFRYETANAIYDELADSPHLVNQIGERQLQELAIRLSELAVRILKARKGKNVHLHITEAELRRQMSTGGQKPYDGEILSAAVWAINEQLSMCRHCPTACTEDWNAACNLFD